MQVAQDLVLQDVRRPKNEISKGSPVSWLDFHCIFTGFLPRKWFIRALIFLLYFCLPPPLYVILIKPLAAHASVIRNESAFMGPKMGECISDEFRLGPQKKSNKYELEFTAQIGNYFLLFAKSPHYFCLIYCFFQLTIYLHLFILFLKSFQRVA